MIRRGTLIGLLMIFSFVGAFAEEGEGASASSRKGLYMAPGVGLNITSNPGSNVTGGFALASEIGLEYYFTDNVGLFSGVGFNGRAYSLNSSASPFYLQVPIGVVFQNNSPLLGSGRNVVGLGVYFGLPLSDFEDAAGTVSLATIIGLVMPFYTYFPISESVELGLGSHIRFGFVSPFSGLSSVFALDVDLGLSVRIRL